MGSIGVFLAGELDSVLGVWVVEVAGAPDLLDLGMALEDSLSWSKK